MSWTYDGDKVQRQLKEAGVFLDHARHDNPAGISDLFGRPFAHPQEPPVTVQPAPTVEVNYYLLQAAQLYEAGAINQQTFNTIVNNIQQ
jgi:hypothetical protein